jgi:hypothetical protein
LSRLIRKITKGTRFPLLGGLAALCAVALGFSALSAGTFSSTSYELRPGTRDSGGRGNVTGANNDANNALGETGITPMDSASYALRPSLMNRVAAPRTVTDLLGQGLSTGSVRLNWSAPAHDGAFGTLQAGASYFIQYAQNATPVWKFSDAQIDVASHSVVPGSIAEMGLGGLGANSTYYFRIWHRDREGNISALSNETTDYTLAKVVSNIDAFAAYSTSITVDWTARPGAPVFEAAQGYRLDLSTNNVFDADIFSSATTNGTLGKLTAAGLAPFTTYYFRVGSYNHEGLLNFVIQGSSVTGSAVDIPPNNPQVTAIYKSSITLIWNQVNADSGYIVEASTAENFSPIEFSSTSDKSATTLFVYGLRNNTTYYLRVGAKWGVSTFFTQVTTNSTLPQEATPLAATFLDVAVDSTTLAWASLPTLAMDVSSMTSEGYVLEASSTNFDGSGVTVTSTTLEVLASTLTVFSPALDSNTTYYYRVGTLNYEGAPNYTLLGSRAALAELPASPNFTAIYKGSATVAWTPVSAQGYQLEASDTADFTGSVFMSSTNAGGASSLSVGGLSTDTTYYFRVGSFNHASVLHIDGFFAATATLTEFVSNTAFANIGESSATLSYNTVTGQGYLLEASSTNFNGTGVTVSSLTRNSALGALTVLAPALEANTTYTFKIGGINHNSAENFVTTVATATLAVVPVAPDVTAAFSSSITVSWTIVDSRGYQVVASTAADFSGDIFGGSTPNSGDSSVTVEGLDGNTTYYLRAGSLNHSGGVHFSATALSTSTLAPLVTDAVFAAVMQTSATVSWTPVASEGYELQASTVADFQGTIHSSITRNGTLDTLTVLAPALDANTTFYFRIGSIDSNDKRNFAGFGSTSTLTAIPGSLSVDAVFVTSAAVSWATVFSEGYEVQASTAPDFTGVLSSTITAEDASTTLVVSNPAFDTNTTYYFRVSAINHTGRRHFSDAFDAKSSLATAPTALTPLALVAYQSSMTVQWARQPDSPIEDSAEGYRLDASTAADFTGTLSSTSTLEISLSTLTVLAPVMDTNSTYYFRVASLNHEGVAGPFAFLGSTSTLPLPPTQLTDTFIDVQIDSVTVAWAALDPTQGPGSSEGYVLEASTAANFGGNLISSATLVVQGSTLSVVSPALADNTTYYFRVGALSHGGGPSYRILGSTPSLAPAMVPSTSAVHLTSMSVTWPTVSGNGYLLQASLNSDFSGSLISSLTVVAGVDTLSLFSPALANNTTYYVRVGALNHATVANNYLFGGISTLADPITGVQIFARYRSSVTVNWQALPSAPLADSAEGYRLQASPNADFSGEIYTVDNVGVALSTLSITGLGADTTYYFRAGSLNHDFAANFDNSFVNGNSTVTTGGTALLESAGNFWQFVSNSGVTTEDALTDPFAVHLATIPGAGKYLTFGSWEARINNAGDVYVSQLIVDDGSVSEDIRFAGEPVDVNNQISHVVGTVLTLSANAEVRLEIDSDDNTNDGEMRNGKLLFIPINDLTQGTDWQWSGIREEDDTIQDGVYEIINEGTGEEVSTTLSVSNGEQILVIAGGAAESNANGNRVIWRTQISGGGLGTVNYDLRRWEAEDSVANGDLFPYFSARLFTMTADDAAFQVAIQHQGNGSTTADAVSGRVMLFKVKPLFGDADGSRADAVTDTGNGTATQHDHIQDHLFKSNYLIFGQGAIATTSNADRKSMELIIDQGIADVQAGIHDSGTNDNTDFYGFQTFGFANVSALGNQTHRIQVAETEANGNWEAYDGSVYVFSEVGQEPQSLALGDIYNSSAALSWTKVIAPNGYILEASTAADFTGPLSVDTKASSTTVTGIPSGLDANTTYYFQVGSRLAESDNHYSTSVASSTLAKLLIGVEFQAVERTSATLSWNELPSLPLADGAEGYLLQASTSSDFSGTISSSHTYNVALSTLSVFNLKMQTTYYFRIGSLNHNSAAHFIVHDSTITDGFSAPANPEYVNVGLSSITVTYGVPLPPAVDSYILEVTSDAADFSGMVHSSQTAEGVYVTTLTVFTPALFGNTTHHVRIGSILDDTTNYFDFSSTSTLTDLVSGLDFTQVLSTAVSVNWIPLPGAPSSSTSQGYLLEASTAADFSGTALFATNQDVSVSTLTISGLAEDTTYYFRAGGLNHNGVAHFTAVASTLTTNFSPPTDVLAFTTYVDSITVTWTAVPASAQDGYRLEASVNSDFSGAVSSVTLGSLQTSLTVNEPATLTSDTTYYFRVGSVRGGEFAYSAPQSTSTQANPVTGTAVVDMFITSATLSWTVGSGQGYLLQAALTDDFTSGLRSSRTVVNAENQLTVLGLQASTFYNFRVGILNHNQSANVNGTPIVTGTTGTGAAPSTGGIAWKYVRSDTEQTKTGSSFSTYISLTPGAGTYLIFASWEASENANNNSYYSRFIVDTGSIVQDIRFNGEPPINNATSYRDHGVATIRTLTASDILKIQIASESNTVARIRNGRIVAIPFDNYTEGVEYAFSGVRAEDESQGTNFETINSGTAEEASATLSVSNGDTLLVVAAGGAETNTNGNRTDWQMQVVGGGLGTVNYDERSWEAETNNPEDIFPYFSARVFTATADDASFKAQIQHRGVGSTTFDALDTRVIIVRVDDVFGDARGSRADDVLDTGTQSEPTFATQHDAVIDHQFQSNYLIFGQGAVGVVQNNDMAVMQMIVDQGNTNQFAGEWRFGVNDAGEQDDEMFLAMGLYQVPSGNMTHRIQVAETTTIPADNWRAYDGSVYVISEVGPPAKNVTLDEVTLSSISVTWNTVYPFSGYDLEASTASDHTGTLIASHTDVGATVGLNSLGLDANTTYYIRVGSLLQDSDTNFSATLSTITLAVPPDKKAVGGTFQMVGLSSVTVAFDANPATPQNKAAHGYELQSSSTAFDGSGTVTSSRSYVRESSTLTVHSPALEANTLYTFRARSRNRGGHFGHFNIIDTTATLAKAPIALISDSTFLGVFESSMTIAWAARPETPQSESSIGYRLEASTAADFSGTVISSETAQVLESTLTALSPAMTPNTTYYFRAASLNFAGVLGPFTSLGSTATLASPPIALAGIDTFLAVHRDSATIAWARHPAAPPEASSNTANGYLLQASTAADFSGTLVSSRTFVLAESTLTIISPNLSSNSTYYYRVAALNRHNRPGNFTFLGATATLTVPPLALAADATFLDVAQTSVTVAWGALPNAPPSALGESARGYRVEASSTNFGALLLGGVTVSSETFVVSESTLTVFSPGLQRNTTYYFRVAALNPNHRLSEYVLLGTTVTQPAAPIALAQEDTFLGIFETSATVAWGALPETPAADSSLGYRLEASTAADFSGTVISTQTLQVLESTLTVVAPALERHTTYYFRVAGLNALLQPGPFTVLYPTSTLAQVLAGQSVVSIFESSATVRFDELPASPPLEDSAAGYLLEANTSEDFSGTLTSSQTYSVLHSTLVALTPALETNTTYYFRVGSLNHNGARNFAAHFATATLALPPAAESQSNTFPAVHETSITVTWQQRPGAPLKDTSEGYRVEASSTNFGQAALGGTVYSSESNLNFQNQLGLAGLERNTTYYFRVASKNHNDQPGNYTTLFATSTLASEPTALALADTFLMVGQSSVTAAWAAKALDPPAQSAEGYELQASTAADFSGTVISSRTVELLGSTLTAHSPALDQGTTYYFRVASLNHNGVAGPFTTLGTTMTLIGGPSTVDPTFLAVHFTSMTVAWGATGNNGYRVEASSTNFGVLLPGGVVIASETLVAAETSLTLLSPALLADTTYYIRAAAFNPLLVPGPYTALGTSATLANAPVALADSYLEIFASSITANWAANPTTPFDAAAQGYRLEASTATDFTGTLISSRSFISESNTLTAHSPALAANTTYYFRVDSLNYHLRPGGDFTALPATATLTAEITDAASFVNNETSVTVNWGDINAAGYQLEVSVNSDFSGLVISSITRNGDLTQLSALSPSLSANTTYYCRVAGINHNDTRHFSVHEATATLAVRTLDADFAEVFFTSATANWSSVSGQGYQVDASTAADFSGTIVTSITYVGSSTELTVTNLNSGTTWYFRVGSLNHNSVPHFFHIGSSFTQNSPLYWDGGAGDDNWYSVDNWQPNEIPTKANSVTLPLAANIFVDASSPAISFSSMTLGSTDGAVEVTLRLSTGVLNGKDLLIQDQATLILDTTAEIALQGNVTMLKGSSITHTERISTSAAVLFDITGIFDIQEGATITVTAKGLPTDSGLGTGTIGGADAGGGGAAYGGAGGDGENNGSSAGTVYGSQTDPQDIGSSGATGGGGAGGRGGGLLRLKAASIIVDGLLAATGGDGVAAAAGGGGGGSGGTVNLTAGNISGSGTLEADGGAGPGGGANEGGGGGGGGRIKVDGAVCTIDATVSVTGGVSTGGGNGADGSTFSPSVLAASDFAGVVASSTSITWSWTAGSNLLSYQVLASTGGPRSDTLSAATLSFQNDVLTPNTLYDSYARAVGCAHLADSLVDGATTLTQPVRDIQVYQTHVTSVTLNWLEFSDASQETSSDGYTLQASTSPNFDGALDKSSTTVIVAESTLTVVGLEINTTYYFRVGGLNIGGVANFADNAFAGDAFASTRYAPAENSVVSVTSETISITWSGGTPSNPLGTTPYTLAASTAPDFSGGADVSSATFNLSATVDGLTPDTTYYLAVHATNHQSVLSTLVIASTPTWTEDLDSPAAQTVYIGSITVQWNTITAQGYQVLASSTNFGTLLLGGVVHSSTTAEPSVSQLDLFTPTLEINTTYYFKMGGLNHVGAANFDVTVQTPTLAALPLSTSTAEVFFTSATVAWSVPTPEPSGYRLDASTSTDFTTIKTSVTHEGSATELTVEDLNSDATYYLRIGSLNHADVPHYEAFGSSITKTSPKRWVGTAGDNNWHNGANWDPAGVPTKANSVTINIADTVVANGVAISFASMTLGAPDASVAVGLVLLNNAGIQDGVDLLIYGEAGLTVDTNQMLSLAGNVTMHSGSSMTHTANPTTSTSSILDISAAGIWDLKEGATVTVTAKGMPGGLSNGGLGIGVGGGDGISSNDKGGGGGGYGGVGGDGHGFANSAGGSYGSVANPLAVGSGGGGGGASSGGQGGYGGGLVQLSANSFIINGLLSADGGDGGSASQGGGGGGSGGSINISAVTISGTGDVSAVGGSGQGGGANEFGGGGGGGRIALKASGVCSYVPGSASVAGGTSGGTGVAGALGTRHADTLAAPTSFSGVVESSTAVDWQWNAGSGADDYQVLASTGGNISAVLANSVFNFMHSALAPNTTVGASVRDTGCAAIADSVVYVTTTLAKPITNAALFGVFGTSITLNWSEFPGSPKTDSAAGYTLFASTSANFDGAGDVSSTTLNVALSTLTVVGLDANTTYYLRVGALNAGLVANIVDAPLFSTSTQVTAVVNNLSPPFTAVFATSITANWAALPATPRGASSAGYLLQASDSADFSTTIISSRTFEVLSTTFSVHDPALIENTTYYLRVAGINSNQMPGVFTQMGSTATLFTSVPADADQPFLEIFETSSTIAWAAGGTSGYRLEASSTNFGALLLGGVTITSGTYEVLSTTLAVHSPALLRNTTYFYRVAFLNHNGVFNTYNLLGSTPSLAPQVIAPAFLNVHFSSATVDWTLPSPQPSGYVLEASTASDFSGNVKSSVTWEGASGQLTVTNIDSGTTFYMRVGALNYSGGPNYVAVGSTLTQTKPLRWDGGAADDNWYSIDNWDPAQFPTKANSITLPLAASIYVDASSPAISFSSMTIGLPGGGVVVNVRLATGILNGKDILIHDQSGLTVDTTAELILSGDLTLLAGSSMTHTANTSTSAVIFWTVAGTFDVQDGATITVSGKGMPADLGVGLGGVGAANEGGGGGGYGGTGGDGEGNVLSGGSAYGSFTQPVDFGSGGGSGGGGAGGAGGGLIRLSGSVINVDGFLFAAGSNGLSDANGGGGGGAGGAINLTAGTVSGTGELFAVGGDGPGGAGNEGGGGGGGGRIKVDGTSSCSLVPTTATVSGGFSNGGVDGALGTTFSPNLDNADAFAGSVQSSTTINWTWTAGVNAENYQVFADTGGARSNILGGGILSFLDPSLLPNTQYDSVVRAFGCAHSTDSYIGVSTTLAKPVDGIQIFETHVTSVTLNWIEFAGAPQEDSSEGYIVEASTSPNFDGVLDKSSATVIVAESTLTVVGLEINTTYYFRVGSLNLAGAANFSGAQFVTGASTATLYSPAEVPLVTVTSETVTVSWTSGSPANPAGLTQYTLAASTAPDFSGDDDVSSDTFNLSGTVIDLLPNTTYYLEVRVPNHAGILSTLVVGATSTWTADVGVPTAQAVYIGSITAQWSTISSQGYEVLASSTNFGTLLLGGVVHSSVTRESLVDQLTVFTPTLEINTTYYFKIGGLNHTGAVNFDTQVTTPTLAALPLSTTTANVFFTSATVSWTAPTPNPSGYRLDASTSTDFTTLKSSISYVPSATELTVIGLRSNTTYYLRIGSLNFHDVPHYQAPGSTLTLNSPKRWTGSGGDDNWYSDNNWSPVGVPDESNSITVPIAASIFVHHSSPAISFSSMTLGIPGGGVDVNLHMSTTIASGVTILLYEDAGLTLDTSSTLALSGDIVMHSGSSMTAVVSTAATPTPAFIQGVVDWNLGGTFDLKEGATITVTGRGWRGGKANGGLGAGPGGGTGVGPNEKGGGGGGYGGAGGEGENDGGTGGPSAPAAVDPIQAGSGGGGGGTSSGSEGGAGGGLIRILAGTINVDGLMEATGSDGTSATAGGGGGGSGGAINLAAANVSGSGEMHADGGAGQGGAGNEFGGGGGGGRIYINATACTLMPSDATVDGGISGLGGAGAPSKPGIAGTIGSINAAILGTPSGFSGVVESSTAIAWNWTAGSGASQHQMIASTGGALSPVLGAAANAYSAGALTPNTSYNALIRASGCAATADSAVYITTTLAKAIPDAQIYGAFPSSITVNWAPFLAAPQADSANSYVLHAATAADFSGTLFTSSSTTNIDLSTLSVVALLTNTTYYLRVGATNIEDVVNFVSLGSTFTSGIEIGVEISTHNLDLGSVALNQEVVISTSFIVSSLGNVAQKYDIRATTTTAGSPWSIALSSGTDTFTLQVLFDALEPNSSDFEEVDKLLDSAQTCTATKFALGQTCESVPAGADRLMWLKLGLPQITTTDQAQDITLTIDAVID